MSKRFFTLHRQAVQSNLVEPDHHDLVADFTGGRTRSLRELSTQELKSLEARMEEIVEPLNAGANRMRRKVIAILAAHGMTTDDGKPDMAHINAWCTKYGFGRKALNHYSKAELPRLVTQAERVMKSDIKAVSTTR